MTRSESIRKAWLCGKYNFNPKHKNLPDWAEKLIIEPSNICDLPYNTPIKIKCPLCGDIRQSNLKSLRRSKHKGLCIKCSLSDRSSPWMAKYFTDEFKEQSSKYGKKAWNNRSQMLSKIRTKESRDKISISSKRRWQSEQYKRQMAECRMKSSSISRPQLALYSILDSLAVKHNKPPSADVIFGPWEVDCVIVDPKIIIEVQGEYWHRDGRNGRDEAKRTYITTYFPEYQYKYLWEHEFAAEGQVKDKILYWVNKSIIVKDFNINQTKIKLIDRQEAELFVDAHHYYGKIGRSSVCIGAFLEDELIAVVVYSTIIRKEVATHQGADCKGMLELSRFCIKPDRQKKNLASYVISRSERYVDGKLLVAFADHSYNHAGTIYAASNWKLDGVTGPSYYYTSENRWVLHKKTVWDRAKKMGMSESEYASKHELHRIDTMPKNRYIRDLRR